MAGGNTKSIDRFLDRVPRPGYNCFDFMREVWLYLKGEDLADKFTGLIGDFANRRLNLSAVKGLKHSSKPIADPCFVVMQKKNCDPHCGVYLDGRILHMKEEGVEFQPPVVARYYFRNLRYYV